MPDSGGVRLHGTYGNVTALRSLPGEKKMSLTVEPYAGCVTMLHSQHGPHQDCCFLLLAASAMPMLCLLLLLLLMLLRR